MRTDSQMLTTARGIALAAVAALGLQACVQSEAGMNDRDSMGDSASMSAKTVMVGGNDMFPNKTIVANAVNSMDHETLVAAVKAAGLVDTLNGEGPFTVFAPTDAAFEQLPEGTVQSLLEPGNKQKLQTILTYHVVPGRLIAEDLMQRIRADGGTTTLETASGGTLTAMMNGPQNVVIEDDKGNVAHISTYDVMQSNGVIHVVDQVLLPS